MNHKVVFNKLRVIAKASMLVLAFAGLPAYSGEGHDHGPTAAPSNGNGPQRLADGSVFLPKPAQRQLNVRTSVIESAELPQSFELNGRVLMDPNAGGKVHTHTRT
jgi:cobalt-zinc-cadmium efflux system membrane fusion protein